MNQSFTNLHRVSDNVVLGKGVTLAPFINLYGCQIGDNTKIGPFVEIQKNATVGKNCKIQSHSFICEGVIIEDGVFIGHSVTFINDKFPRSTNTQGELQSESDWTLEKTLIQEGASIGSGSTIMCGITIGKGAIIGAGSMVTRSVEENTIVAGNPARPMRKVH